MEYINISGECISQMSSIEMPLLSDDLFLFSAFNNESSEISVNENCNVQTHNFWHTSNRVSYCQLSSQLLSDISSALMLGSMSWEQSSSYSLEDHEHDYTKLSCSSIISSQQPDTSCLFTVVADATPVSFYARQPSKCKDATQLNAIGQLKFLAVSNLEEIDQNSEYFDGWVYPDGRAILSSKFTHAWKEFGDAYGSDASTSTFNIPCLSSFIELCPLSTTSILSSQLAEQKSVPAHFHTFSNFHLSGEQSAMLSIQNYDDYGAFTGGSHGVAGLKENDASYHAPLFFSCKNLSCSESRLSVAFDDSDSTYPRHCRIPVLMYIGVD